MPKEKKEEKTKEETTKVENIVLKKTKERQLREDKRKKWEAVGDAVQAAREAYTGGFDIDEDEKTISFEEALNGLIDVLGKIKSGELKLGGLESEGLKAPKTEA